MRIKKLSLRNGYKRFHNLTIDLGADPKRIVALVGPNGCGKSSVLDGMLFHHNAYGVIGNTGGKDYKYHSMRGDAAYDYQNVSIEFVEGSYTEIREQRKKSGKENTIFSFRSPYRFNSNLNVIETRATTDIRLNNYGATSAADLDFKMEESYRRLYVLYNKYLNANDCKPSEARAKIIGDLNRSIKNCLDLQIASMGDIESSRGSLFFSKPGHPAEFDFNVLSSGEKEVIDLLLDIYVRKDDFDDSVFLFDEPELHISTAIQKNLLREIDRLIGENCQIWITTHSIGFLRAIQEEMAGKCQVIQFRPEDEMASKPCTLTPLRTSHTNWRDIFAIALDDLAQLVSPRRIIYCEGRDSPGRNGAERGLDAQVFNIIFSDSYPDTMFISSGGNTELDQRSAIAIAILGKVFPTLDIWILKDRDMASGRDTNEQDRIVYLQNNALNHRVLRRWEIENYLFEKEVLQAYCADTNQQFDEAAYDALVVDIVNQNLKDDTAKIKSLCGIKGSVNPERFKLALSKYVLPSGDAYQDLVQSIFLRQ